VPRHPAVAYAVVVCCLLVLVAVVGLTIADSPTLLPALFFAALLLAVALPWIHALRIAGPVQHNNRAVNAMLAGRIEEAERHLIEAERSHASMIRITTKIVRGQLCVHRAELSEALLHLDAALAARLPWLGRFHAKLAIASARGTRAFVRALRGDQAGARADLAALERLPLKRPDTQVSAALANSVLLLRAGDRSALREFLDRHRTLLFEFTSPRERALVRALSWSSRKRDTAYRTPMRTEARRPQQGLDAWLDAVLPGAGDLAEDLRDADELAAADPVERVVEVAEPVADRVPTRVQKPSAPSMSVAMPARGGSAFGAGLLWKTLALWVVLIVTFLAVWQFFAPEPLPPAEQFQPEEDFPIWAIAAPTVLLFAAIIGGVLWRGQRAQRALLRAFGLIASDPPAAHDLLVRLTRSTLKLVSAQAHLSLAGLGERAADFDVALAHAEAALRQLQAPGMRAVAYDLLLPDVHAMRALAFAGLDRMTEASVELAAIEHDFPAFYLLERSKVRVLQLLAARAGDYRSAARIAADRSPDLPISYRDDVLGELAEVVARGTAVERTRLNRLRHEIDGDTVLAHWLDVAAPKLMARFDDLRAA
jgi:hypothetical protein